MMRPILPFLILSVLAAAPAQAQQDKNKDFDDTAEDVARQPLKDVGVMKDKIPPVLVKAQEAPYARTGLKTCAQYRRAVAELDTALGPDVDKVDAEGRPVAGRLAEAGAKSVVGSLIPFRGLVREVTGAASTDRKIAAAYVTGTARRSYLKGYGSAIGCKF
jgi:hypothetical protein